MGTLSAVQGATLLRRVPELDLVMGPHHANRYAHSWIENISTEEFPISEFAIHTCLPDALKRVFFGLSASSLSLFCQATHHALPEDAECTCYRSEMYCFIESLTNLAGSIFII